MKDYLKIAYRNFLRNRIFSFINILGLAVGLASTLLIMIWVNEELSYEKFNNNEEKLFRLLVESSKDGEENVSALHPVPLVPYLKDSYSNISKATRYSPGWGSLIEYNQNYYKEVKVIEVDPDFFDMFSFPLIEGSRESIFTDIFSVVISEDFSKRVFGSKDPIGKIIKINQREFTVSGIVKNCPSNTHIQFDAICLFDSRDDELKKYIPDDSWDASAYYVYVMCDNLDLIEKENLAINNSLQQVLPEDHKTDFYYLQAISRIHLHNKVDDYLEGHSSIKYIYIFTSIALLILIIACINYMNLTTAKFESRAKEVGVRKVCGASRRSLITQFLSESALNTFIAILLALILVELFRPFLNSITGKDLIINYANFKFWFWLSILLIGSALISGSYPALFLSSFKIVNIIKGITIPIQKTQSILKVRSILVVFQLFISIGLITIVLFMFSQFRYIQNKDLGYVLENVICFSNSRSFENNIENIKDEFLQHPSIESIAQGNNPSNSNYGTRVKWEGYNEEEGILMAVLAVDEDYLGTYQIKIEKGRGFSKEIQTDKDEALIINESAAKLLKFEDPVGQRISYKTPFEGFKEGTIIGIVKDFHTDPLYNNILPLIINQETFWRYELGIRFNDKNNQDNIIHFLDSIWNKYITDSPFEYYYFEDRLISYYNNETKMFQIIVALTIIGIIISLLGIVGLTYFTTESLTKEIGIRKVLGSSIRELMIWLIKDVSKWTIIAMFIAFPVSLHIINKWISNFAYHINVSIWFFITGGIITYLLVILISILQIRKIAKLNPVESLRYE